MDTTVAMVIGNRDDADVGVLGEWADGRGIELRTVNREDDRLPSLDGCSLVVSMGSVWRVHDAALEPLLQPEQALLRRAVAGGTPVLGHLLRHATADRGVRRRGLRHGPARDRLHVRRAPRAGHPARAVDGVPLRRLPPTARRGRAGRQRARSPGLPAGLGAGRPVPPRGRPGGGQALVGRERGRAREPRAVRGLDGRGRGRSTPTTHASPRSPCSTGSGRAADPAGAPRRGAACARRRVRRPAGAWPC